MHKRKFIPWVKNPFLTFEKVFQKTAFNLMLLLLSRFSRVRLCATPRTAAHQAPCTWGFPGGSVSKESVCNARDLGMIPGWGHDNPLQYSSLENPHEQRSLASYSPWDLKELDTTERLSHTHTYTHTHIMYLSILESGSL